MSGAPEAEGGAGGGRERRGSGTVKFADDAAARTRLYESKLQSTMQKQNEAGAEGLRHRRAGSGGAQPPAGQADVTDEEEKPADMGMMNAMYAAMTAPMRLGKTALTGVANTLSPFAWADFMMQWMSEITPVRLKRLGNIFYSAFGHISSLAGTPPGKELGWATRNVVDSFVETIAAPKGQRVVMDGGLSFVRVAEAFDTPEARAAYTQVFKLMICFLEALATEEGKDLFKNLNDFVLRLASLANSPQTTVAVAEFVSSVCRALQQEHESFARERINELSPVFRSAGPDDGEPLKKEVDVFWNEEFVLGTRSASQVFSNTGGGSVNGDAGEEEDRKPRAQAGNGEGAAAPTAGDLPSWDSERLMDITQSFTSTAGSRRGGLDRQRQEQGDKTQMLKEFFEASVAAAKAQEPLRKPESEEHRAMMCLLSFLVFSAYTIFALIGLRTTVSGVYSTLFPMQS